MSLTCSSDVDDDSSMTLTCSSDVADDSSTVSSSSQSSDLSFIEDVCLASLLLSVRANRLIVTRMNWKRHVDALLHENLFHVKYRMLLPSFNKLLELLSPTLTLNEKYAEVGGLEPISHEVMLNCTIPYLAGGSYHDVRATAVISKPSFYHIVWHTILTTLTGARLWLSNSLVAKSWTLYGKDFKVFLGMVC
jgi:hypothetical protein